MTNKIQGTGLGMSITKSIIDLMGGTIDIQSELGKGSVFTVDLIFSVPLDENNDNFFADHEITRVLVEDDEIDITENIQSILSDAGLECDAAIGGLESVDKATRAYEDNNSYDVIILDWKMPDMDGVECVRRIRKEIGKDVPIFVLSSYDVSEIEDEAKKAGVPIQEDRTLVELMRHLTVDDQIPEALYETVAEIFSFIYKLDESVKNKK